MIYYTRYHLLCTHKKWLICVQIFCAKSHLDICVRIYYNIIVRQRRKPDTKGSEDMDEMTTAELNQFLENIAKLIEANAETVDMAAQIVRDSKVKA